MHELAHLVLGLSSVCNDISEKSTSNNKTELLCNNIAGLALVPAIRFKQHPDIDAVRKFGLDDTHVRSIARDFAVSKEVILHRLWSEGIIEKQLYFDTLKRYNEEYLQYQAKKPKGFLPPVLDKGTQIGKLYARTVLTSYHTQSISTRDASNFLLNLSAHHFAKMEGWCFK
jgi:Zn-dependent peptidase ImmA (M78 family)